MIASLTSWVRFPPDAMHAANVLVRHLERGRLTTNWQDHEQDPNLLDAVRLVDVALRRGGRVQVEAERADDGSCILLLMYVEANLPHRRYGRRP